MAGPAGRSPEEEALLKKAMRVLPGGVLGGYYAPQELAFVVREARGPRLYDFSGREYIDYILGVLAADAIVLEQHRVRIGASHVDADAVHRASANTH